MGIFDKRVAFKPFEYPEITKYKDAINHSYWLVSEWNFTGDIQDFHVKLNDIERSAIKNTLLAISQIEVSVKKFWTKLGERFPKAEFEQIGVTFGESECYDKQTEVLTDTGFKFFKDLLPDDLVAQYDINNKTINFTKPLNYIIKDYNGIMNHYNSDRTDLMVTPNHEILTMHQEHTHYIKKPSSSGRWGRNYRYPIAGKGISSNPYIFNELDRLLIAIQTDGSLYGNCPTGQGRRHFCFNFKKSRKIERIKEIFQNLGYEYTETKRENGFTAFNSKFPDNITVDLLLTKSFGYIDITRVDYNYSREFIKELSYWDCNHEGGSIGYYNTSIEAIDKVQSIALLGGFGSNKAINRSREQSLAKILPDGSSKKTAKDCYILNICDNDKKTYPYKIDVNYCDKVYCVTVESGAIVTRRNKRIAICGNCRHSDAYSHLLEVLSLNNDFALLLENPVIQGRVDYLTKYLRGASDNSNENYTLTLTLFSLFIENISLFSQFAIIKAFNKYNNTLKDIDNVVQSTQQEENLHALLGVYVIKQIQKEFPDWFNDDFYQKIYRAAFKAFEAESKIIDWIFEKGELLFLTKDTLKEFVKDRFNKSIEMIGGDKIFETNAEELEKLRWFNEELDAQLSTDFFHKKPNSYNKFSKSIRESDLF